METSGPARGITSSEPGSRSREIANRVAELAREILGESVEVLWFGSWPRGEAQARSDIDIALHLEQPIPLDRMAALRDAVEKLPTLYEIDLIDLSSVGDALRQEIVRSGVRL